MIIFCLIYLKLLTWLARRTVLGGCIGRCSHQMWELLHCFRHLCYPLMYRCSSGYYPFYIHGLTLLPAWISNHMPSKMWDEINHPFPNFNGGCTVEVWEWMSNLISHFMMDEITYPSCDWSQTMLVNCALGGCIGRCFYQRCELPHCWCNSWYSLLDRCTSGDWPGRITYPTGRFDWSLGAITVSKECFYNAACNLQEPEQWKIWLYIKKRNLLPLITVAFALAHQKCRCTLLCIDLRCVLASINFALVNIPVMQKFTTFTF